MHRTSRSRRLRVELLDHVVAVQHTERLLANVAIANGMRHEIRTAGNAEHPDCTEVGASAAGLTLAAMVRIAQGLDSGILAQPNIVNILQMKANQTC